MTVEPSAVRFNVGTSVRTWADDKPPQPIIANLFRDMDESNDGLTPAVEEVARSVMWRKTRAELYRPVENRPNREQLETARDALREARIIRVLCALRSGPMRRKDVVEVIGFSDGAHASRFFDTMQARGLVQVTKGCNFSRFSITEEGRAHIAHKVAAE